jgi:hypothetical protein
MGEWGLNPLNFFKPPACSSDFFLIYINSFFKITETSCIVKPGWRDYLLVSGENKIKLLSYRICKLRGEKFREA